MDFPSTLGHSFLHEPEEEPNFASDASDRANEARKIPQTVFK